jgi:hypothetical protein
MSDNVAFTPHHADRESIPPLFPTHLHAPEFWVHLGRAIATFGFLEEVLGKAIFACTAMRKYGPEEVEAAYGKWLPQLERALTDQLSSLADSYSRAVKDNPELVTQNVDELVACIKKSAIIRNVLCHGSWRKPDEQGASVPLFVNRNLEVFDAKIDIEYLKQVQAHIVGLVCEIIDSVTLMGFQFPGSAGPGKPIWE